MAAKIVVSGTSRNRVRINLGLFEIKGPWRETKFHQEIPIVFGSKEGVSIPVPKLAIKGVGQIRLTAKASRIDVEADTPFGTYYIYSVSTGLANKPKEFSFQPIKGAIFAGTASLIEEDL